MNNITIYNNPEFGNVRTLTIDNEPWFVGKDVAEILGYANTRDTLAKRVDEDDKIDGVAIRDSIGREQKPILINESGLYSLILSSKLPTAKRFKRWVTSEVLPAIRKTGSYSLQTKRADLSPTMQTLYLMLDEIAETQREASNANKTANLALTKADNAKEIIDKMNDTITTVIDSIKRSVNWRKDINSKMRKIATVTNKDYNIVWSEVYSELDTRARCNVQSRLRNHKKRMLLSGASQTAMKNFRKIDVIEQDPKLKEILNIIVAENYIRSCC